MNRMSEFFLPLLNSSRTGLRYFRNGLPEVRKFIEEMGYTTKGGVKKLVWRPRTKSIYYRDTNGTMLDISSCVYLHWTSYAIKLSRRLPKPLQPRCFRAIPP